MHFSHIYYQLCAGNKTPGELPGAFNVFQSTSDFRLQSESVESILYKIISSEFSHVIK